MKATIRLMSILNNGRGEARFVGGCVRDSIIGRDSADIDISTNILPEDVIKLLNNNGIHAVPIGIKHGTITAIVSQKPYEITTLRRDVKCDGRHAEVIFTDDWQEDAARRDFTMNAMSMDLEGNIYDYFNGIEDLDAGIVRFVGSADSRIKEDYLRILRMFRFQAYYGKAEMLADQIESCAKNADGIESLSSERIQVEMIKILSATDPIYVIATMHESGVLTKVISSFVDNSIFKKLKSLLEIESITYDLLDINPLNRLAIIVANVECAVKISVDWKLSKNDTAYFCTLVDNSYNPDFDYAENMKLIRKLGKSLFFDKLLLKWAGENNPNKADYLDMIEFFTNWKIPKLPVRGKDIIDMGIGEGQEIGKILQKAENYWESNEYRPTRKELLEYIG